MKLSVLMGIYNSRNKEILEKSLKSILNQTYREFELIICNDGSTNDCFKWAKEICNNDNRVIFIENDRNRGLAYTLNHCLNEAHGEYVARMDDDDESHLDRFEKQVEFLDEHHEYDIVGSNMNLFNNSGIWGERKYKEFPQAKDFLYRVAIAHPTIMCRTEALKKVNGYRDIPQTLRVEDYDLFMRMFAKGSKIYNFQEPIFNYREDVDVARGLPFSIKTFMCIPPHRFHLADPRPGIHGAGNCLFNIGTDGDLSSTVRERYSLYGGAHCAPPWGSYFPPFVGADVNRPGLCIRSVP